METEKLKNGQRQRSFNANLNFDYLVDANTLNLIKASQYKNINRYTLREGKIYGNPVSNDRYKIIRISGDRVAYKDLAKDLVSYMDVDDLLKVWIKLGFKEITEDSGILNLIKEKLSPLLGGVLTMILIDWIKKRL